MVARVDWSCKTARLTGQVGNDMYASLFDDPILPLPGHRTGAGTESMRIYVRQVLAASLQIPLNPLAELPSQALEEELARRRKPPGCPCLHSKRNAAFGLSA